MNRNDIIRKLREALEEANCGSPDKCEDILTDLIEHLEKREDLATKALDALVSTIENTGGVVLVDPGAGLFSPAGEPEWIDLAGAYIQACGALGREAKVAETEVAS